MKVHAKAVAYREAGNRGVAVHSGDAQAFDHSSVGMEYQHGFVDDNSFTQLDAAKNIDSAAYSSGIQSNGMELPLPEDSWLNWEAIMTDLGVDEPPFRDGL